MDVEERFMRDCLYHGLSPAQPLPLPPTGLDWKHLYELLKRHRLAAHFYVLAKEQRSLWQESFREKLRLEHYSLLIYGDECARRIRVVLTALAEAGIPVIVLKGWAYIQTIYAGDYSQRFCEDIDLLIRPKDIDASEKTLIAIGYQGLDEVRQDYHKKYWNARAYYLTQQPTVHSRQFTIGLHWSFFNRPSSHFDQIDLDPIYQRTLTIKVAGADALQLATEDEIIYACGHLLLHHDREGSLFRFFEIAALIARASTSLDWITLYQRAWFWRKVVPLKEVLLTIEKLWAGSIPDHALAELAEQKPGITERWITWCVKLVSGRFTLDYLLYWLTTPGFKPRLSMIFQDAFPSPVYMKKRYGTTDGDSLPWLYLQRFSRAFCFLFKKESLS
jgi:hypothetical protein